MQGAGRPLENDDGTKSFQYVALWYKHGEPVFGRAHPDSSDRTLANFGWNGQENAGSEIGSMQMIVVPSKVSSEVKTSRYSIVVHEHQHDLPSSWVTCSSYANLPCRLEHYSFTGIHACFLLDRCHMSKSVYGKMYACRS